MTQAQRPGAHRPGAISPRPDDLRRGAAYAVMAAAAFALMAACVKAAAAGVGNEVLVFFRSAVGLVVLLPWLLRQGGLAAVKTTRLGGHLWRAAFGCFSIYAFFYAIANLHLAQALLFTYSTPLFIPFIAWAVLREPPPPAIFGAVALGLIGIALIVKPLTAGLDFASFIGLASAVTAAAAMVTIRSIADTEPAPRIVLYFSTLATAISSVPLLWTWQTPTLRELVLLLAIGALATVGQLCLTRAYSLAPAARIGAFTYVAVVFGGLLGWALWDERPDAVSVAGMLLVIACCLLAGWRRA
jgi:drug/metabolite transporter (DMT)-like permease